MKNASILRILLTKKSGLFKLLIFVLIMNFLFIIFFSHLLMTSQRSKYIIIYPSKKFFFTFGIYLRNCVCMKAEISKLVKEQIFKL